MNTNLKQELTWFLNNLDLQLYDITLEDDDVGINLYFDTADIRDAVLGMRVFYNSQNTFDRDRFLGARSLVHCLATSGALGRVSMLSPHQAEFLTLMNFDFNINPNSDDQEFARKFNDAVKGVIGKGPAVALDHLLDEPTESEIRKFIYYLKGQAESAKVYFRALESVGSWRSRLTRWIKEGLLHIAPDKLDFGLIVTSSDFQDLKATFDSLRPRSTTMNNFADAAAVCILINQVKSFVQNHKVIPRFYVPSWLFVDAIYTANLLDQLFSADVDLQDVAERDLRAVVYQPNCVLRDSHYFIFKSIFRPNRNSADETLRLRDLRRAVAEILQTQERLTDDTIRSIEVSGRPLSDIIDEIRDFSFLKNIWLQFLEVDHVKRITNLLRPAKDLVHWNEVDKAIKLTKDAIQASTKGYEDVKRLSDELDRKISEFRRTVDTQGEQPDIFRDLGLLRFGFPSSSHDSIRQIVTPIFHEKEMGESAARNVVIKAIYLKRESDNFDIWFNVLVQACAVLWLAKMDDRLVKLLDGFRKSRPFPHYSLEILYAAAVFRLKKGINVGRIIVDNLIADYTKDRSRDRQKKVDLAVGIAYLNFHLWSCLEYFPSWYPPMGISKVKTAESRRLINHAIEYARKAYDAADEHYLSKRVYALNQYAYYMIMGAGEDRSDDIENAIASLIRYKSNQDLWQYRYDDTLARHFHRLAASELDEGTKRSLLSKAERHLDEARRFSHGDEELEFYGSILDIAITKRKR